MRAPIKHATIMSTARHLVAIGMAVLLSQVVSPDSAAQRISSDRLSGTFQAIFDHILTESLERSPGQHANHYIPAAERANAELVPALNSLISTNISSFPLSSTVAGITFDFSTGQPVRLVESLGPIFAETAQTLGDRKVTIGFNATTLSFNRLRNIKLEELQFSFPHEDLSGAGLGDETSELDILNVQLGLNASAAIFAFYATYGVGPNLDVGVAVPFVNVNLDGTTRSVIDSYTMASIGRALHLFAGTPLDPILVHEVGYSESVRGIGDIGVRLKYRFPGMRTGGIAALVDVRLPTGDENNFLGTGSLNTRFVLIGSRPIGAFTPHVNLGYEYRAADFDSDEIEFAVGFDQQISSVLTFALDILGEFDLSRGDAIRLFPGTETITFNNADTGGTARMEFPLTNVENRWHDNTIRLAVGFRAAATDRFQVLGNVLVPLTDGGLYSAVTPTVGVSVLL